MINIVLLIILFLFLFLLSKFKKKESFYGPASQTYYDDLDNHISKSNTLDDYLKFFLNKWFEERHVNLISFSEIDDLKSNGQTYYSLNQLENSLYQNMLDLETDTAKDLEDIQNISSYLSEFDSKLDLESNELKIPEINDINNQINDIETNTTQLESKLEDLHNRTNELTTKIVQTNNYINSNNISKIQQNINNLSTNLNTYNQEITSLKNHTHPSIIHPINIDHIIIDSINENDINYHKN